MKLPPAWEAIVDVRTNASYGEHYVSRLRAAVERCYALANKPVRGLTDAEIDAIYDAMPGGPNKFCIEWGFRTFARELLCAHVRKQHEPETVTFRAARFKDDPERIAMCRTDGALHHFWEWLEPAQTIEVKLP